MTIERILQTESGRRTVIWLIGLHSKSTSYLPAFPFWGQSRYHFKAAHRQLLAGFSENRSRRRSRERGVYLSLWRSCASDRGKNLTEKKEKVSVFIAPLHAGMILHRQTSMYIIQKNSKLPFVCKHTGCIMTFLPNQILYYQPYSLILMRVFKLTVSTVEHIFQCVPQLSIWIKKQVCHSSLTNSRCFT